MSINLEEAVEILKTREDGLEDQVCKLKQLGCSAFLVAESLNSLEGYFEDGENFNELYLGALFRKAGYTDLEYARVLHEFYLFSLDQVADCVLSDTGGRPDYVNVRDILFQMGVSEEGVRIVLKEVDTGRDGPIDIDTIMYGYRETRNCYEE